MKHTPGPWAWFGSGNMNSLYLATTHSGRRYVMGFKRWGMSGAQPQFQPEGRGMVDASELLQFEVGDRDVVGVQAARKNTSVYRMDVRGIDCPDARLIAASPCLLAALVEILGPLNVCSDNPNVADDVSLPIDMTMGELRKARAAIAKATGASA
jgi:hypothetical protein